MGGPSLPNMIQLLSLECIIEKIYTFEYQVILHYDKVDMLNGAQKSVNYTTTVKKNFFCFLQPSTVSGFNEEIQNGVTENIKRSSYSMMTGWTSVSSSHAKLTIRIKIES